MHFEQYQLDMYKRPSNKADDFCPKSAPVDCTNRVTRKWTVLTYLAKSGCQAPDITDATSVMREA